MLKIANLEIYTVCNLYFKVKMIGDMGICASKKYFFSIIILRY